MVTRLVDILNNNKNVLHTFPITLDDGSNALDDSAYQAKALEAAASARLIPDVDLDSLTARIHISRGGQMEPYGDELDSSSETKEGLKQVVRERAYLLWESDGCPQGREEEFWNRALEQHRRERAYVLWQQQGSAEGHAEENWHQIREFQER
jgi:hypothetical protein